MKTLILLSSLFLTSLSFGAEPETFKDCFDKQAGDSFIVLAESAVQSCGQSSAYGESLKAALKNVTQSPVDKKRKAKVDALEDFIELVAETKGDDSLVSEDGIDGAIKALFCDLFHLADISPAKECVYHGQKRSANPAIMKQKWQSLDAKQRVFKEAFLDLVDENCLLASKPAPGSPCAKEEADFLPVLEVIAFMNSSVVPTLNKDVGQALADKYKKKFEDLIKDED